jgi:glutamate-1-semialdehyde aminotransferase
MTYGGDALALAAARAVLVEVEKQPVVEHLWGLGARWLDGARIRVQAADVGMGVGGFPPRSHFTYGPVGPYTADEIRSLFLQECVRRGVLFGVPVFMSWSHRTEDVDGTHRVLEEALAVVAHALRTGTVRESLEGLPVEPIFRPAAPGTSAPAARTAGARRGEARA